MFACRWYCRKKRIFEHHSNTSTKIYYNHLSAFHCHWETLLSSSQCLRPTNPVLQFFFTDNLSTDREKSTGLRRNLCPHYFLSLSLPVRVLVVKIKNKNHLVYLPSLQVGLAKLASMIKSLAEIWQETSEKIFSLLEWVAREARQAGLNKIYWGRVYKIIYSLEKTRLFYKGMEDIHTQKRYSKMTGFQITIRRD